MNYRVRACIGFFALLGLASPAAAQTEYAAVLDGAQANAGLGTGSAATGTASLSLNAAGDALSYSITLTGLDLDGAQTADPGDDVTSLHFHLAPPGLNGGVVFGLIAPGHDADDLVINPAAGTLAGIWEDTDVNPLNAQLANLQAGNLYLNVHTAAFPAGEIRGQINLVPREPSIVPTLSVSGVGFLALTLLALGLLLVRRQIRV